MFTSLRILCLTVLLKTVFAATPLKNSPILLHPQLLRNKRDARSVSIGGITNTGPITTSVPNVSNFSSIRASTCMWSDSYCSLGAGHALDGMRDVCVLWDDTCTGDKASAAQKFSTQYFNSYIELNTCWTNFTSECTLSNPPGRFSAYAGLKSWMRSPQCFSVLSAWNSQHPGIEATPERSCCNACDIQADSVDIFYWKDPNADTSCLSIIDSGPIGVGDGATTSGTETYWACTKFENHTSTIITTGAIYVDGTVTYRVPGFNPWEDSPCGNASTSRQEIYSTNQQPSSVSTSRTTLMHSMTLTESQISTVVSGKYTFTSPSIYANFWSIHGDDSCGQLNSFRSTMVAFSPGELSTYDGVRWPDVINESPFNPADLPCPPQSVQSKNWWKPRPGEPFRPYFVSPEKLNKLVPEFHGCEQDHITLLDPPIALQPADAMAGPATPEPPPPPSPTAAPNASPFLDAATQTAPSEDPTSLHVAIPSTHIGKTPDNDPAKDLASDITPAVLGESQKQKQQDQQQQTVDPVDRSKDPSDPPQKTPAQNQEDPPLLPHFIKGDPPSSDDGDPSSTNGGDPSSANGGDPSFSNGADPPSTYNGDAPSENLGDPPSTPAPTAQNPQPQSQTQLHASRNPLPPAPSPIITIGSTTFTANPTVIPIAPGKTLSAGGPAIQVAGTTLSLHPFGSLIIGTSTLNLNTQPSVAQISDQSAAESKLPVVLDISESDGQVITIEAGGGGGGFLVDGVSLSAGEKGTTVGGLGIGAFVTMGFGGGVGSETESVAAGSASSLSPSSSAPPSSAPPSASSSSSPPDSSSSASSSVGGNANPSMSATIRPNSGAVTLLDTVRPLWCLVIGWVALIEVAL